MEKRRQKCDIWVLKKVKQKYSYVIFSNINYTFFYYHLKITMTI